MKRLRILLYILAALLMVGLGVFWFHLHYEQVTVKKWVAPKAEARRNPYLALERFFARMGRPLECRADVRFLDQLPAGGVLILDSGRRTHLTPERQGKLLNWVHSGGYLMVVPEFPDDPLMQPFGVGRHVDKRPDKNEDKDAGEGNDPVTDAGKAGGNTCPAASAKEREKLLQISIPGARPLLADRVFHGLQANSATPDWQAQAPGHGAQMLHFRHGQGHVTVITSLGMFSNYRIGKHDHAEIAWTLVQTYQPKTGSVSLMTRLEIPTLWQWLTEHAREALIAGAALLLLWLWRVVPRFGLPAPDPEPDRRQLREHLAAVGRYLWRSGGLQHWLQVGRESFQSHLALRHPALAALPLPEQTEALARLTHRPKDLIALALYRPADTVSSFTSAMRTLRNLEQSL